MKKTAVKKDTSNTNNGIIEKLDSYFNKNKSIYFGLAVMLTIIFGIFLFDMKISVGGDDSAYIVNAKKFLDGITFPSHLGAFYSIFLSFWLAIFGVKLVLFKIFSFLFIIGHLVIFYYAFRNRVSSTLLVIVLLFTSFNGHLLYFASQTYSEAMFLLLQSLSLFFFLRVWEKIENNDTPYMKYWPSWLALGLCIFLIGITRMIGYSMLAAVLVFLLLQKKYLATLYSFGSFMVFYLPYAVYKKVVWGGASSANRIEMILYKNIYNKAQGTEDFAGMVTRFIENAKIYLSRHFPTILGLKDPTNTDTSLFLALILIALFILSLVLVFKKHKVMLFVALYLGAAIAGTFITLQQTWGQQRMILVYVPLILLLFSVALVQISQFKNLKIISILVLLFFVFVGFKSFGYTLKRANDNSKILAKNMRGNKYYGFTPDWINFLKLSEMCGEKMPEDVVVASRKPSMSFIYGKGKDFYGIYRIPATVPDTIIKRAQENSDTLLFLSLNEIDKIPDKGFQFALKIQLHTIIYKGNLSYGAFNYKANQMKPFLEVIKKGNLYYSLNPDEFLDVINKGEGNVAAVSPDELLERLRTARVQYMIVASLRINPNKKTNRTINTIRRYMFYIQYKYPAMFTKVYQVGKDNDEPAMLYQVNYKNYGIQLPAK